MIVESSLEPFKLTFDKGLYKSVDKSKESLYL